MMMYAKNDQGDTHIMVLIRSQGNKSVSQKYKDQVFMLEQFYANSANAVDFTANAPNWRGVRDVFYTHIRDLLMGKSPDDVAREIDEEYNAAISSGREQSILHE